MIFLTFLILLLLSVSLVFIVYRIKRYAALADPRMRMASCLMLSLVLLFMSDIAIPGEVPVRYMFYMTLALVPLILISSPICKEPFTDYLSYGILVMLVMSAVRNLLCHFNVLPIPGCRYYVYGTILNVVLISSIFLYCFGKKIYDVHSVMQNSSVWSWLCLGVDTFYIISLQLIMLAYISVFENLPHGILIPFPLLLAMMAASLTYRLACGSVFVLCPKHERRIVESMKVSRMEIPNESSKMDAVYKEVYERVVQYFENEKPYLSSELTINEVVSVVYSNKVYISRAISQYTGRNFCQFVNYYRIMFAVESFRNNDNLKISELAALSGFNSVVSFNMAFRLFMKENPSDWCRRERRKRKK